MNSRPHNQLLPDSNPIPPQGTAALKKYARMTQNIAHAAGKQGKADVHIHSTYSDGTGSIEQILAYTQHHTNLDVIAITDHDAIEGALRARELWSKGHYRFEIVVGEEISTRDGHLLGLYIEHFIPPGLSMERSIDLIHEQGGLAVIAHPFHHFFRQISCQKEVFDRIQATPDVWVDGIETWNASFCGLLSNRTAMEANRTMYGFAELGNSDAHTPISIGCGFSWFEGKSSSDLRHSIEHALTAPAGKMWNLQAYYHWAIHMLKQKHQRSQSFIPLQEEEFLPETLSAEKSGSLSSHA